MPEADADLCGKRRGGILLQQLPGGREGARIPHGHPQGRAKVKTLLTSRPGNSLHRKERKNTGDQFLLLLVGFRSRIRHPSASSLGKNGADPDGDLGRVLRCEAVAGQKGNRASQGGEGFPAGRFSRLRPQPARLADQSVRQLTADHRAKGEQFRHPSFPGGGPPPFLESLHDGKERGHATVGVGDRFPHHTVEGILRPLRRLLLLPQDVEVLLRESPRLGGHGPDLVQFLEEQPHVLQEPGGVPVPTELDRGDRRFPALLDPLPETMDLLLALFQAREAAVSLERMAQVLEGIEHGGHPLHQAVDLDSVQGRLFDPPDDLRDLLDGEELESLG